MPTAQDKHCLGVELIIMHPLLLALVMVHQCHHSHGTVVLVVINLIEGEDQGLRILHRLLCNNHYVAAVMTTIIVA